MKKIIWRIFIIVLLLVVVAIVAGILFLDPIVKKGIETVAPGIVKVPVTVDSVHISLIGASGKIKGLVIGNPEGFQSPHSISVGSASLSLKVGSLFSDKIVIKSLELKNTEITVETTLHGINLKKIQENLDSPASTSQTAPAATPEKSAATSSKKIEVDDFLISNAKVRVSVQGVAGNGVAVPIPDIHLIDLGKSTDGITPTELTRQILRPLLKAAIEAAGNVGKDAVNVITKDAGKTATDAAGKVTEGLGNLLKKK